MSACGTVAVRQLLTIGTVGLPPVKGAAMGFFAGAVFFPAAALAGWAASALGSVAMLRNASAWVEPFAAANNLVLPLWMLVFGAVLLRHRALPRRPAPVQRDWALRA